MPKNSKQQKLDTQKPDAPIPMTTQGMALDQLITMLLAAQAQGATHVRLACETSRGDGIQSDIDWVSMAPVNNFVYIGAILPFDKWDYASNEALLSLDW